MSRCKASTLPVVAQLMVGFYISTTLVLCLTSIYKYIHLLFLAHLHHLYLSRGSHALLFRVSHHPKSFHYLASFLSNISREGAHSTGIFPVILVTLCERSMLLLGTSQQRTSELGTAVQETAVLLRKKNGSDPS